MADDDHFYGEIVSEFLIRSCFHQRLNDDIIGALLLCARVGSRRPSDDDEVGAIPLTTGSVAEFYIQPMLSCIGDFDVMYHRSDELAILEGTAPPTHLPAEFNSRVKVFEILDSEFPGYGRSYQGNANLAVFSMQGCLKFDSSIYSVCPTNDGVL